MSSYTENVDCKMGRDVKYGCWAMCACRIIDRVESGRIDKTSEEEDRWVETMGRTAKTGRW